MTLSPRFEQALTYASIAHSDQVRKGTEIPYVSHLLAVDSASDRAGRLPDGALEALMLGADPGGQAARNVRSRADTAASSRNTHSQTTSADQPAAASASSATESRARLRAIFAIQ